MSKKKHEEHEEHVNHEAWVIPYADMLTLLMALFLVMWATGQTDKAKFERVAANIRAEFSAAVLDGGENILEGIGPSPVPDAGKPVGSSNQPPTPSQLSAAVNALAAQQEIAGAVAAEKNALETAQAQMQAYLKGLGLQDAVNFKVEDRGLIVTIVSDKVLFDSGSEGLRPEASGLLDAVAGGLRDLPNDLIVEGHTDATPIRSGRFPSNWELSTARAASVLRYLTERAGIDGRRLSATGYADTRPIAPNETPDGRSKNRRVEIVVVSPYANAASAQGAAAAASELGGQSRTSGSTGTGGSETPATASQTGTVPTDFRDEIIP